MNDDIQVMIVAGERRWEIGRQLAAGPLAVAGEARFGPEAVARARHLRPDVIVVGVEEPIARPLRAIESLTAAVPGTPVVAVSSLDDRELIRKAMRAGADDYLVAPVESPAQFQAIVALHLNRQRTRRTTAEKVWSVDRGEVISVFGAKGGIGKTTLAVNLSAAIAFETQQRVALLDFDTQMGDVALLMDAPAERTLADAVGYAERLESDLLQGLLQETDADVQILPAPAGPEESRGIGGRQMGHVLDVAAGTFDYVVVDTGPQLGSASLSTLQRSTLILLVTALDRASLKRAKIAHDFLLADPTIHAPIKVVVNHAYAVDGFSPDDVEAMLGCPVYWTVPWDRAASDSVKLGRPAVLARSGSKLGRSMTLLARAVCGFEGETSGRSH